jgi:hypothetical protein
MSKTDKPGGGTAEAGMARIFAKASQPTDAEVARAMDLTIRAMARDAYNPNALNPPAIVKVANAPEVVTAGEAKRGTGWANEVPIESPMPKGSFIEGVVGNMIDRALGPAVPKKREESAG